MKEILTFKPSIEKKIRVICESPKVIYIEKEENGGLYSILKYKQPIFDISLVGGDFESVTLVGFKNMDRIDLEKLKTKRITIESASFTEIVLPKSVPEIEISRCNLSSLDSVVFHDPSAITHLDLSHNAFRDLDLSAFTALRFLSLVGNKFKTLPPLSCHETLEYIDISNNPITSTAKGESKSSVSLDLPFPNLRIVEMCHIDHAEEIMLHFSSSHIEKLVIGGEKLKRFKILPHGKFIEKITIFESPAITNTAESDYNCESMNIEYSPNIEAITIPKSMKYLRIIRNYALKRLEIPNGCQLKRITFDEVDLANLTFPSIEMLEQLNIQNCRNLYVSLLPPLPSLEKLYIHSTAIVDVDGNVIEYFPFENFKCLKYLNVHSYSVKARDFVRNADILDRLEEFIGNVYFIEYDLIPPITPIVRKIINANIGELKKIIEDTLPPIENLISEAADGSTIDKILCNILNYPLDEYELQEFLSPKPFDTERIKSMKEEIKKRITKSDKKVVM